MLPYGTKFIFCQASLGPYYFSTSFFTEMPIMNLTITSIHIIHTLQNFILFYYFHPTKTKIWFVCLAIVYFKPPKQVFLGIITPLFWILNGMENGIKRICLSTIFSYSLQKMKSTMSSHKRFCDLCTCIPDCFSQFTTLKKKWSKGVREQRTQNLD